MYVLVNLVALVVCLTPCIQGVTLGNTTDGDVEIYYGDKWRPLLAGSILRMQEQKVLCRSLGFQSDTVILTNKPYQPIIGEPKAVAVTLRCYGNETNVGDCQEFNIDNNTNSNETLIHLKCFGLSLKLIGGDNSSGLLQVQEGKMYYPVCVEPDFYQSFAHTACGVMGFHSKYGFNLRPQRYIKTDMPAARSLQFECTDIAHGVGCELHAFDTVHKCMGPVKPGDDAFWLSAIICTDEDPDYRLTKVDELSQGRLEVKFQGEWGAVCGRLDAMAAEVACRSLNLSTSDARSYSGVFNGGIRATLTAVGSCNGTEESLTDCLVAEYGESCRDFQSYQSLSCSEAHEGDVRGKDLDGGISTIFHNKQWLPFGLNSTSEGKNEAQVLCRSLNMPTYSITIKIHEYVQKCWLKYIHCNGTEDNILQCSGTNLTESTSPEFCHSFDISCSQKIGISRIDNSGLLEIQQYGRWGTICTERLSEFRNYEASVICTSLNKSSSLSSVWKDSNSPKRSGPIWLTYVKCNSTATNWGDCTYRQQGECTHDQDVYVTCDELNKTLIKYRLKEKVPELFYVGYPEISINGQWGSICGSGSKEVAEVICRSLGLEMAGARFVSSDHLVKKNITSKVWLDLSYITCEGSEKSVMDCIHGYPGDHDCRMRQDWPALYCGPMQTTPDYSLRLVDGPDSRSGRLEMMMFNQWGTVCNTNFTQIDAKSVCWILNYPHEHSEVAETGRFQEGTGIIWLSDLSCNTWMQQDFRYCSFSLLGRTHCHHSKDVGVFCQKEPIIPPEKNRWLATIIASSVGGVVLIAIITITVVYVKRKNRSRLEMKPINSNSYTAQ